VTETVRYRLTEREGDRIRVEMSASEMVAPSGPLETAPGSRLDVRSFLGTIEGTCEVDLGLPFPVTARTRVTMRLRGLRNERPVTASADLTSEVEPR
jgi:hypothetical protein